MDGTSARKFNVGGVLLDRPFKIRRLGHFGFNVRNFDACVRFYSDLLGFALSDSLDFSPRLKNKEDAGKFDTTTGWFMRHGGDHHSFVLFPKPVLDHIGGRSDRPDVTINQITWQVGSLREVAEAENWLRGRDTRIRRSGRDQPGSNWHVYPYDPDDHVNELYYGIEQIGWDGFSKPPELHEEEFRDQPGLPQIPEYAEVDRARARGTDIASGYRHEQTLEATYDVGGILLPRPFKAVRVGPVRLFTDDLDEALGFYRDRLGMTVTEEIEWNGHRCAFLRVNTEHHSLALYPIALRSELGLSGHTTACRSACRSAITPSSGPPSGSSRKTASRSSACRPSCRPGSTIRPSPSTPTATHPALLLHGTDRLGREAAQGVRAPPDGRRMAGRARPAARHLRRRAVPGSAGVRGSGVSMRPNEGRLP